MITYFFPPLGGVGVQRILKFVSYLPRSGWRPIVLTPKNTAYFVRDDSLLVELPPDLEIHRSAAYEPARLAQALAGLARPKHKTERGSPAQPVRPSPRRSTTISRARRTMRALTAAYLGLVHLVLVPDEQVTWLPSATRTALAVHRTEGFDVIFSNGPPFSCHLIAGLVKQATRRPWVADFRDPWVGNPFAPPLPRYQRRLQELLERWVVRRADRVVVAMSVLRDELVRRYPERADRFVWIPNGYDRRDLEDLPDATPQPDGMFRLVFGGSLYREREVEVFLTGLERLVARRPEIRNRLRVEFVGWINDPNQHVFDEAEGRGPLAGMLERTGFLPRREALARLASADALLQLMADVPGSGVFAGGKLLEYLAFDRPILAMMPPGEGRRVLEGLDWGIVADVDPASVADAVERLLDEPPPTRRADPDGRYDRVNEARELAEILDSLVAAR
jgi:glycosyltransferase involved in cell wall biosynthesis